MSGGHDKLQLRSEDVLKFLACQVHLGSRNVDFQMEQYVYKRRLDGTFVINLKKTWEKLLLAARAIAAVENPADVFIISSRPYGQRAILKFAAHTGATAVAGRFTPGAFTNQIQAAFREPRLLVVTDPRLDHQAITEASYVNVPVIAFCHTDSPLKLVDICIPCNNKGAQSLGLMWWMLAREVLILRGTFSREMGFRFDGKDIMPDLYFYRDPEEAVEKEQAKPEKAKEEPAYQEDRWGQELSSHAVTDWSAEVEAAGATGLGAPGGIGGFGNQPIHDWAAESQAEWTAAQGATDRVAPTAEPQQWGGGGTTNW